MTTSDVRSFCFISGKGGVGKTTLGRLAVQVLALASERKVLLVSVDLLNPSAATLFSWVSDGNDVPPQSPTFREFLARRSVGREPVLNLSREAIIERDRTLHVLAVDPSFLGYRDYREILIRENVNHGLYRLVEAIIQEASERGFTHIVFDCMPQLLDPSLAVAAAVVHHGGVPVVVLEPLVSELVQCPLLYTSSLRKLAKGNDPLAPGIEMARFVINKVHLPNWDGVKKFMQDRQVRHGLVKEWAQTGALRARWSRDETELKTDSRIGWIADAKSPPAAVMAFWDAQCSQSRVSPFPFVQAIAEAGIYGVGWHHIEILRQLLTKEDASPGGPLGPLVARLLESVGMVEQGE